jgi:sodium--glutamate symport carrier gltS
MIMGFTVNFGMVETVAFAIFMLFMGASIVGAFFIDIVNAFVIQAFVSFLSR